MPVREALKELALNIWLARDHRLGRLAVLMKTSWVLDMLNTSGILDRHLVRCQVHKDASYGVYAVDRDLIQMMLSANQVGGARDFLSHGLKFLDGVVKHRAWLAEEVSNSQKLMQRGHPFQPAEFAALFESLITVVIAMLHRDDGFTLPYGYIRFLKLHPKLCQPSSMVGKNKAKRGFLIQTLNKLVRHTSELMMVIHDSRDSDVYANNKREERFLLAVRLQCLIAFSTLEFKNGQHMKAATQAISRIGNIPVYGPLSISRGWKGHVKLDSHLAIKGAIQESYQDSKCLDFLVLVGHDRRTTAPRATREIDFDPETGVFSDLKEVRIRLPPLADTAEEPTIEDEPLEYEEPEEEVLNTTDVIDAQAEAAKVIQNWSKHYIGCKRHALSDFDRFYFKLHDYMMNWDLQTTDQEEWELNVIELRHCRMVLLGVSKSTYDIMSMMDFYRVRVAELEARPQQGGELQDEDFDRMDQLHEMIEELEGCIDVLHPDSPSMQLPQGSWMETIIDANEKALMLLSAQPL